MVYTIAVVRRGQQRSLATIFQLLRVEIARSPQADLCVGPVHSLLTA